MKILFIRASNYPKHNHPENTRAPMDIGYSASLLEMDGHQTHLIDMKADNLDVDGAFSKTKKIDPDMVFIKTETPNIDVSLELSKRIKQSKDIDIYFFGQHATTLPETVLSKNRIVDACVMGEPEYTIREITNKNGNDLRGIKGAVFFENDKIERTGRRKLIENLDELPMPKHEFFLNGNYKDYLPIQLMSKRKYGYMITSRGCPYDCIYCSPTLRVSYGKNMRFRSIQNVVDEMEFLVDSGVNVIVFKDDVFTVSKKRTIELCKEIIKRDVDVKWFAQTRSDCLDSELVDIMKDAGCGIIAIGVESGSNRILDIMEKDETREQAERAFDIIKNAGINSVGYFMLGAPTETIDEMKETIELCKKIRPDMIQVAFFTPYPGSKAYENYCEGSDIDFNSFTHYDRLTLNCSDVSDSQLKGMQRRFYKEYIFSIPFIINYIRKKIPTAPFNILEDIEFVKKGTRFIYKNNDD